MLTELVTQGLYFRFPQVHLLCYVYDTTLKALGTDALVWTVVSWFAVLLLVGSRNLRILELQ